MLTFASVNIEINRHRDRVAEFFRREQPDVICLQECPEDDVLHWKEVTGYEHVFVPHGFVRESKEYFKEASGRRYGVAIFARELKNVGHTYYVGKKEFVDVPVEEYEANKNTRDIRVILYGDMIVGSEMYRVCTTHFPVTVQGSVTERQLEVMRAFLDAVKPLGEVIICGDFNAPRGREVFDTIARSYKDCIPKEYTTSIDKNLHRAGDIQFMVDGLFLSDGYEAHDVALVEGVSDHKAVLAKIERK